MNFFGHAVIAGRFEPHPVFVLGAMLPDFCGMLGLKAPQPHPGVLARGVHFHHVTDHAFHELASFRELYRAAVAQLDSGGVRRGTARAVAHVGVELLIDAELAENEQGRSLYFAALAAARESEPLATSALEIQDRERLGRLAGSLAERGVAQRPATEVVVMRLERALGSRQRLAIRADDVPLVREWVELFRERVVASASALVSELTSDIERRLAA
jgi:hypothetical protein